MTAPPSEKSKRGGVALSGKSLIVAMCVGQVGNLLPHVVVPAIMAQHLMPLWKLSGGEAGLMASGYAFGYMLTVPVLTTLTDRIDARLILLCGSVLSALATIAFGLFADGLLSATLLWCLAGVGFAGAYMPGLKALTDRLPPGDTSRAVTFYTSSFSFGVGLSFLVSQLAADGFGWRNAFFVTGAGPLAMIAACILMPSHKPAPASAKLLDFGPVFRNRSALGYIFGYGAHCFELYGIRTWIVASGRSSWRRTRGNRCPAPLRSVSCSRSLRCLRASSAMRPRSASAGTVPSPRSCWPRRWSPLRSACLQAPRRGCCWWPSFSMRSR
jgi:MFS family permease